MIVAVLFIALMLGLVVWLFAWTLKASASGLYALGRGVHAAGKALERADASAAYRNAAASAQPVEFSDKQKARMRRAGLRVE